MHCKSTNVSCAPHCCDYGWGQRRLQSLCRVTAVGEPGLHAGNHPAPPCSHLCWRHTALWWQLILHRALGSSSSAKGSCCKPDSQRHSTRCLRQELPYSLHRMRWVGLLPGGLQELPAGGMHREGHLSTCSPIQPAGRFLLPSAPAKGLAQSCLARHKLTTSQAKKQESVWQLDKMYPRSCRKPIDQD